MEIPLLGLWADVRNGLKAEVAPLEWDVCFPPKADAHAR
jgi:hypothetical protein